MNESGLPSNTNKVGPTPSGLAVLYSNPHTKDQLNRFRYGRL